jgi:hypothetical protein
VGASSDSDGDHEKQDGGGHRKAWIWWGPPLWHDMGYMAVSQLCGFGLPVPLLIHQAVFQLCGAIIFWISTL